MSKTHMDFLNTVAQADVTGVTAKEVDYGSSWKQRGGTGAFMMLARKWDRLENALKKEGKTVLGDLISKYDIFEHVEADKRPEGILDDINDLAGYLLLVRAELMARSHNAVGKIESEAMKLSEAVSNGISGMVHPFGFDAKQETVPGYDGIHEDA